MPQFSRSDPTFPRMESAERNPFNPPVVDVVAKKPMAGVQASNKELYEANAI